MHAIISDIHGNLEALTAVLSRLSDFPIDGIICLGDVVGYGPDSIECFTVRQGDLQRWLGRSTA